MTDKPKEQSFSSKYGGVRGPDNKSAGFAAKYTKKSNVDDDNISPNSTGRFSNLHQEKKEPQAFTKNKDILRKKRNDTDPKHAESTRKSRVDCVFLVRGKDKGREAWHYVLVDKPKKEMFLAKSRSGSIDVAQYGEILHSGWGQDPPEDIVKKIEDEFGT